MISRVYLLKESKESVRKWVRNNCLKCCSHNSPKSCKVAWNRWHHVIPSFHITSEPDGITIPPVHIITDTKLSHSLYISCLYLFCPHRGSQRSCRMKISVFIHTPHYHCPIIHWFGWFSDRCDFEDKINTLYTFLNPDYWVLSITNLEEKQYFQDRHLKVIQLWASTPNNRTSSLTSTRCLEEVPQYRVPAEREMRALWCPQKIWETQWPSPPW
jgi:hypothetical protein